MLTPIRDRVAVVTGASRGIGKGIGQVFGRYGVRVLVVARQGFGVTAEITAAGGEAAALGDDARAETRCSTRISRAFSSRSPPACRR